MLAAPVSLVLILLYYYLEPILAVGNSDNIHCEPQNPPLRKSTDCFHAIGLMVNTLHPSVPAIFRYGECMILLQELKPQTPPPPVLDALPPPLEMKFLRSTHLITTNNRLNSFDHSLLQDAKVMAANILKECLQGGQAQLGWGIARHRPIRNKYYFIALNTVPADMPRDTLRWEIKSEPGEIAKPVDAPYHVYNARAKPVNVGPSASSGHRDGDPGASSSEDAISHHPVRKYKVRTSRQGSS